MPLHLFIVLSSCEGDEPPCPVGVQQYCTGDDGEADPSRCGPGLICAHLLDDGRENDYWCMVPCDFAYDCDLSCLQPWCDTDQDGVGFCRTTK